jgi:hypothetical protein
MRLPLLLGLACLLCLSPRALALTPVVGASETAEYNVTFDATWSAATHPLNFPAAAHFSGLIGGLHDASVGFWAPGALASNGIELMAELGAKSGLTNQVNAAISAGSASALLSGSGIFPSPGTAGLNFSVGVDHPLVTLVSMIAPSPDWFVGVRGLSLLQGGDWVDELVVDLWPYDAGTDDGTTFLSGDADSQPALPISLLSGFPFGGTGPLGTFTFTRTDPPADPWLNLGFGLAGTYGVPGFSASGPLCAGTPLILTLDQALENSLAVLMVSDARFDLPFFGGVLVPDILAPGGFFLIAGTGATGGVALGGTWPTGVPPGSEIYLQIWVQDAAATAGFAASEALGATTP